MMSWDEYFDRLLSLRLQFDFARKALDGWAQSREAIEKYAKEELEDLRRMLGEGAEKRGQLTDGIWIDEPKKREEYLEHVRTHALEGLGDVKGRLSQNEYLLQVAIFESFMKRLHRSVLETQPTLLKPDRPIPLGKLISQGERTVVDEEIERAVQSLDRESVEKKGRVLS